MKITVKVRAKSSRRLVLRKGAGEFEVWVSEPPDKGRANEAVRRALSDFLGVSQSKVKLLSGQRSKHKLFEIPN